MRRTPIIGPQPGLQALALSHQAQWRWLGGRAGVGKSWLLLLYALQQVQHRRPGNMVIFRRRAIDIRTPGSIWYKASGLFSGLHGIMRPVRMTRPPDATFEWRWPAHRVRGRSVPSGSFQLTIKPLPQPGDEIGFQGTDFTCVAFDEATHFLPAQWMYLWSRLRANELDADPVMLMTLNPTHHGVIRDLLAPWIDEETGFAREDMRGKLLWAVRTDDQDKPFLVGTREEIAASQATLSPKDRKEPMSLTLIYGEQQDNVYQDWARYNAGLDLLTPWLREQLKLGNWNAGPPEPGQIWHIPRGAMGEHSALYRKDDLERLRGQRLRLISGWDYGRGKHGLCCVRGLIEPGAPPRLWIVDVLRWTNTPAHKAAEDRLRSTDALREALPCEILEEVDYGDPAGEAVGSGDGWAVTLRNNGIPLSALSHTTEGLWWNQPEGIEFSLTAVQSAMDHGRLLLPNFIPGFLDLVEEWSYDLGTAERLVDVNRQHVRVMKDEPSHLGDALRYLVAGFEVWVANETHRPALESEAMRNAVAHQMAARQAIYTAV